jgi:hypothetical protein
MNPGQPCVTCHRSAYDEGNRDAAVWSVAGTVFNARHEVNNCFGFAGSPTGEASTDPLRVELTDADGRTLRLGVNRAGNFMSVDPVRAPFRNVRVVHARGASRVMRATAPHGDCNACHTRMGTTTVPGGLDAPGRIVAP